MTHARFLPTVPSSVCKCIYEAFFTNQMRITEECIWCIYVSRHMGPWLTIRITNHATERTPITSLAHPKPDISSLRLLPRKPAGYSPASIRHVSLCQSSQFPWSTPAPYLHLIYDLKTWPSTWHISLTRNQTGPTSRVWFEAEETPGCLWGINCATLELLINYN